MALSQYCKHVDNLLLMCLPLCRAACCSFVVMLGSVNTEENHPKRPVKTVVLLIRDTSRVSITRQRLQTHLEISRMLLNLWRQDIVDVMVLEVTDVKMFPVSPR